MVWVWLQSPHWKLKAFLQQSKGYAATYLCSLVRWDLGGKHSSANSKF